MSKRKKCYGNIAGYNDKEWQEQLSDKMMLQQEPLGLAKWKPLVALTKMFSRD